MADEYKARETELAKWQMAAILAAALMPKVVGNKTFTTTTVELVQEQATLLLKAMKASVDDAVE